MNTPSTPPVAGFRAAEILGLARSLAGPALILAGLVVAGRYAGRFWPDVEAAVDGLGLVGYAVFVGAWVLLSLTCFPVSVLGVSAGALFGPWLGLGLVLVAGLLGGSAMFWLGRGLLHRRIREMVAARPRLAAVDRLAGQQAFKLNALTRLSPLNFGLASYTLAAGSTTFRAYFWGMWAILPSMGAQVWFGWLARSAGAAPAASGSATGKLVILVVGVVFFALLSWVVGRMVRQAWQVAPTEQEKTPAEKAAGQK